MVSVTRNSISRYQSIGDTIVQSIRHAGSGLIDGATTSRDVGITGPTSFRNA
jgi:hypothetical protein